MKSVQMKFILGFLFLVGTFGVVYFNKPVFLILLTKVLALHGWQALFMVSVIFIVSNILLLPLGLPINLLAGMIWGTLFGGIFINILATFVAGISFFLGRWLGHYFIERVFKKNNLLTQMKEGVVRYDWQFITLARINPIIPFGVSNYLFGMIPGLSFKHYIMVTAAANFIPSLAFASMGSVFKTFSIPNANIQQVILEIGIALFIISLLFAVKIAFPRQYPNKLLKREVL